eukprot:g39309.t1
MRVIPVLRLSHPTETPVVESPSTAPEKGDAVDWLLELESLAFARQDSLDHRVMAAVEVKDTYYRFFLLGFRSPQLQAHYQSYKQAVSKKYFLVRVVFFALLCGPLWLLHLPVDVDDLPQAFNVAFWTLLLVFQIPLLCSILTYLIHKRHPEIDRLDDFRYCLEQIGLIGAVLSVGCLLLARGSGGIGLTPCPFPLQPPLDAQDFLVAGACNVGATAGLVPFLETATIMVLPLYFTTITNLTRSVVLLMLLIAYGTAGASVISMSLNAGVQPENILFYIFALTFVWPIFHYEAQTANSFLNAVSKMRVVLRLCEHSASLRMHAEHMKGGQHEEKQQQWAEAVNRAYEMLSEDNMKSELNFRSTGSIRKSPASIASRLRRLDPVIGQSIPALTEDIHSQRTPQRPIRAGLIKASSVDSDHKHNRTDESASRRFVRPRSASAAMSPDQPQNSVSLSHATEYREYRAAQANMTQGAASNKSAYPSNSSTPYSGFCALRHLMMLDTRAKDVPELKGTESPEYTLTPVN